MAVRILLVDDEPDIRDVLKLTLEEEKYEIMEAPNGEEGLKLILSTPLDLVILDYKMPRMTGLDVLRKVKADLLLRHLPIIMLTGKSEVEDKIDGLDAGADDYITKPFEPKELLARMRMVLNRSRRDLEANPLTRLPGNISILNELSRRIASTQKFAVCYIDLNKFKSYNDKYGFEHGDNVIRETARLMIRTVQNTADPAAFIGHIGGDDFVIITHLETADAICKEMIRGFDEISPSFYNETDRKNGYIFAKDRQGNDQKIPLLSISIGVVTNEFHKIEHVAEVGEIGAELKAHAKSFEKSTFVKDQRKIV